MRLIEVPDFVKGLIFDCDGTLVDSMPMHMRSWEYVITAMGGQWDYEFFHAQKGMPEEKIVRLYNDRFMTAFDPAATVAEKHRFFKSHATEFEPIPHVIHVVERYRGVLPMAVASGGVREIVRIELEALHLIECFSVVLTADDAIAPKPAPDIFLEAAKRLGVLPEHCQVFEDGDLGLDAARKAGMLPTDIR